MTDTMSEALALAGELRYWAELFNADVMFNPATLLEVTNDLTLAAQLIERLAKGMTA